jgi:SAM-dependent methyltransferase
MMLMEPLSQRRLRLRDQYLQRVVDELFHYDERMRGLDLVVKFDRGVAHISGAVADRSRLETAKDLIGRLDGVLGVWDCVQVDEREPVILDLGCGPQKQYGSNIGVDRLAGDRVDVIADLAEPLPFADSCADGVFLVHILEHLLDFLALMDEVHRVLRPDGVAYVLSPWWRYVNAVADPTHVRLIDVQTIKGICDRPGSPHRWFPLHAACDGATVFAELKPIKDGSCGKPDTAHLSRFFD